MKPFRGGLLPLLHEWQLGLRGSWLARNATRAGLASCHLEVGLEGR